MLPSILIIEHIPTQFDAPFYHYARQSGQLALHVVYTRAAPSRGTVDAEIGRAPGWDNLLDLQYPCEYYGHRQRELVGALPGMLQTINPLFVLVCGYTPLLHYKVIRKLFALGVPVGLRSDNTLPHSTFRGIKGIIKRIVLPPLFRRFSSWHPMGSLAAEYLKTMAGCSRPTFLFPYNVDNAWFHARAGQFRAQRKDLRAALGLGADDFVVLGVSKWHVREDPMTLVNAFAQLHSKAPGSRLIFVGDGPLRPEVEKASAALKGAVVLPGYAPYSDLPKYYALADVYVHPSPNEPWGVSVNEAMACGLPVIAADGVGAAVDLIREGKTGWTFPSRNAAQLADKLERLLSNPGLAREMGRNAFEHMKSWSYGQTESEMLKAAEYYHLNSSHIIKK